MVIMWKFFILLTVLTNKDQEHSNRLTRQTPFTDLSILGFSRYLLGLDSLSNSLGWILLVSSWAGLSHLFLRLDALGFNSGWMLSASPRVGCSRLLLHSDGWVYLQGDAKVRNGFMFIRQKLLFSTSCVDLLFIQFS